MLAKEDLGDVVLAIEGLPNGCNETECFRRVGKCIVTHLKES